MLKENRYPPAKTGDAMSRRVWGRKGRGGVSPVLVFSKCQLELHGIHQEAVEIMGNNGSPGLGTKSPRNNGSPGARTVAGAPWDGEDSVTKGFWLWTKYPGPSSSRSTRSKTPRRKSQVTNRQCLQHASSPALHAPALHASCSRVQGCRTLPWVGKPPRGDNCLWN